MSVFWRYWALSILQYPSRKRIVFSVRGGPDLRKWRRAPGGCVTPLSAPTCRYLYRYLCNVGNYQNVIELGRMPKGNQIVT